MTDAKQSDTARQILERADAPQLRRMLTMLALPEQKLTVLFEKTFEPKSGKPPSKPSIVAKLVRSNEV